MKKIKEIWSNRSLIFQGIKNTIFKKSYIEKVAKERMEICNKCDELDLTGEHCAWSGTQPCCAECGCSLEYKTRSLSSACPFLYWRALEKEETVDDYEY